MAEELQAPSDHRRKWDKAEYEELASSRLAEEEEESVDSEEKPKREPLKQRDFKLDFESRLGKSMVITKTSAGTIGGYYCKVCDCLVKDSINFLDHVNGKKHQRNLGMSMRVERSTLDQVKQRFQANRERLAEEKKKYDLEKRMEELKEEEEKLKESRREQRRNRKRKASALEGERNNDSNDINEDLFALMGFSGFGTSKH